MGATIVGVCLRRLGRLVGRFLGSVRVEVEVGCEGSGCNCCDVGVGSFGWA